MKFLLKIGLVIPCLIIFSTTIAANCESTCQLKQIEAYFLALDKISRQDSTIKEIDSLLALTHDDVKYIHVEYEANFTKESWRKAFVRNLERGAYQKSNLDETRITNTIFGKNHTAIEYSNGVIQQDGSWQQAKPLLVVFGFTEGRISLIKELW